MNIVQLLVTLVLVLLILFILLIILFVKRKKQIHDLREKRRSIRSIIPDEKEKTSPDNSMVTLTQDRGDSGQIEQSQDPSPASQKESEENPDLKENNNGKVAPSPEPSTPEIGSIIKNEENEDRDDRGDWEDWEEKEEGEDRRDRDDRDDRGDRDDREEREDRRDREQHNKQIATGLNEKDPGTLFIQKPIGGKDKVSMAVGNIRIQGKNPDVTAAMLQDLLEMHIVPIVDENRSDSLNDVDRLMISTFSSKIMEFERIFDTHIRNPEFYNVLGLGNRMAGDHEAAIRYWNIARSIARETEDKCAEVNSLHHLAEHWEHQGDQETLALLVHDFQALECNDVQDTFGAKVYTDFGEFCESLGQDKEAIGHYKKALHHFEQHKDQKGIVHIYTKLGKILLENGQYKPAFTYFVLGLMIMESNDIKDGKEVLEQGIAKLRKAIGEEMFIQWYTDFLGEINKRKNIAFKP